VSQGKRARRRETIGNLDSMSFELDQFNDDSYGNSNFHDDGGSFLLKAGPFEACHLKDALGEFPEQPQQTEHDEWGIVE
jgi:hypothetical protein